MAELFELRGESPATTAEPLRRKVSRLRTNTYTDMAYVQVPKHYIEPRWTLLESDTSFTLPVSIVTAYHSAECSTTGEETACHELNDRLETLRALRNVYIHSRRPAIEFSEALRDSLSDLTLSFAKLAQFEINEAEASEHAIRVWLDEFESAARFRVLKQELAHTVFLSGAVEEEEWTEAKNRRRCELVDREIDGTLSNSEALELQRLQAEMLAYRRKLAPLPLEEARELHQALLQKARKAHEEE